ncbi:hypothetical protein DFH09DRAFT_914178, partial [Mycena vulgaris]
MDGIQLGDLLGVAVTRLLEFSQPYPGDDRLPLASEDFNHRRFHVERSSGESYIVRDLYFFEDVILPMEYLRVPQFTLAGWYARHKARTLNMALSDVESRHVYGIQIDELLAASAEQYLD